MFVSARKIPIWKKEKELAGGRMRKRIMSHESLQMTHHISSLLVNNVMRRVLLKPVIRTLTAVLVTGAAGGRGAALHRSFLSA